jgi:uncharacterized protein YndB with AHSA1/START domain
VIEVRRVFDAPRALVWAAWTDPAQLPAWWGRRGWHIDPATLILDAELVVRSDQRLSDALRRRAIAGMRSAFDRLAGHLQHNLAKEHA